MIDLCVKELVCPVGQIHGEYFLKRGYNHE